MWVLRDEKLLNLQQATMITMRPRRIYEEGAAEDYICIVAHLNGELHTIARMKNTADATAALEKLLQRLNRKS